MATYSELATLLNDPDNQPKAQIAVIIAAYNLITGTPTAADRAWASAVLANPQAEGIKALRAVIAANAGQDLSVITGASDTVIQNQINAVVPQLVSAYAGA